MDFHIVHKLSMKLDQPHPLGIDWMHLAAEFHLTLTEIEEIKRKDKPTIEIIRLYETNTAKTQDQILADIRKWADRERRVDVRNIIDTYIKEQEENRVQQIRMDEWRGGKPKQESPASLKSDCHVSTRSSHQGQMKGRPTAHAPELRESSLPMQSMEYGMQSVHLHDQPIPHHLTNRVSQNVQYRLPAHPNWYGIPEPCRLPFYGMAAHHGMGFSRNPWSGLYRSNMGKEYPESRYGMQRCGDHTRHTSPFNERSIHPEARGPGGYNAECSRSSYFMGKYENFVGAQGHGGAAFTVDSERTNFPSHSGTPRRVTSNQAERFFCGEMCSPDMDLRLKGPVSLETYNEQSNPYETSQFVVGGEASFPKSSGRRESVSELDPRQTERLAVVIADMKRLLKKNLLEKIRTWKPVPALKRHAWFSFKDLFTSLQLKRGYTSQAPVCELKDIYKGNPTSCDGYFRRVLLLGEPGSGKTVVCLKHLIDYAAPDGDPINGIDNFDLVFLVELRYATFPIERSIYTQRFPIDSPFSDEEMWAAIRSIQKKVLFIFDGFDELPLDVSKQWTRWIFELLQGKRLAEVSVLVTSRMHHIEDLENYFDVCYINHGYRMEESIRFVKNFFHTMGFDPSAEEISCNLILEKIHEDPLIKELAKNPLSLTLLCLLATETQSLPKSVTRLYEVLIQSLVRRNTAGRCEIKTAPTELMKELEILAFAKVESNTILFDYDQLGNKQVCELGFFLTKFSTVCLIERKHCEFIHQSFQDFFAAKYFCRCAVTNQAHDIDKILREGRLNLMCQYICGLLPINHPLLKELICRLSLINCRKHARTAEDASCGHLQDYDFSLRCLAEVFYSKASLMNEEVVISSLKHQSQDSSLILTLHSFISAISQSLPECLEIIYSQCSLRSLNMVTYLLYDEHCAVKVLKLGMDGLHQQEKVALKLAEAINANKSLSVLELRQCFLDDTPFFVSFLCTVLDRNNSIKVLKLIGWMNKAANLTSAERQRTSSVMSQESLRLETLILHDFDNHRRVGYILDCFPSRFHTIDISHCNLDTATEAIVNKILSTEDFHTLHLKNNCIRQAGMDEILDAAMSKPWLRSLKLCSIYTSSKVKNESTSVFTSEICQKLGALLENCTLLTYLDVSGSNIRDECGRILCEKLETATALSHLDVSGNSLRYEFMNGLCNFLESPLCRLEHLNLSGNLVRDTALSRIANALAKKHVLKTLVILNAGVSAASESSLNDLRRAGISIKI